MCLSGPYSPKLPYLIQSVIQKVMIDASKQSYNLSKIQPFIFFQLYFFNLRVGETGVGEMGVGKTGVGEMGVGEMGIPPRN